MAVPPAGRRGASRGLEVKGPFSLSVGKDEKQPKQFPVDASGRGDDHRRIVLHSRINALISRERTSVCLRQTSVCIRQHKNVFVLKYRDAVDRCDTNEGCDIEVKVT